MQNETSARLKNLRRNPVAIAVSASLIGAGSIGLTLAATNTEASKTIIVAQ